MSDMFKKIRNYFSSPKRLAIANAILIVAVIVTNTLLQAFCRPSLWATIVLVICFANTILYPLLTRENILFYISNFISGISLGVFIYCIIFLEHINFFGAFAILLFGLGLITYIPHFFVFQLFYKYILIYKNKLTKLIFCLGIFTFLGAAFFINVEYKHALNSIDRFKKSNYTSLDQNFMTERILGMYFKYHTQICEFDGWRPPIHEPSLVIGQWFNGRLDPLSPDGQSRFDLGKRIQLYKKFFPDKKIKLDCACAVEYSQDYHNSQFETP
jgi:hypothetical protein